MQTALDRPAPATAFPKTTLCLWRDVHDPEQILIGSETRVSTMQGTRKRRTAWLTCHLDALLYLSDRQTYDRVREAGEGEFPMAIEMSISIKE